MIQLTPRSYVFNGLEIIRDTLIPFIGKVLRKKNRKSWWYEYIYKKMVKEHEHITRSGDINDLYVQLDELLCLLIINKNKQIFNEHINFQLLNEVHEIRTYCAHVFLNGGAIDKVYADDALIVMSKLINNINKENKGRIIELKNQMNFHIFNNKPVTASRETLIAFLNKKIWEPSLKLLEKVNTLNEDEKEKIKIAMKCTILKLEQNESNEDILNWFKYHIYSKEGIYTYKKLKNIEGVNMPTFEDYRLEFLEICYGESL